MSNDRDDEMMLDRHELEDRYEFQATIETSLAASALASGRRRLSSAMVVIGWFAIVAFSAFATILRLGMPVALIGALGIAVLAVFFFQIDPFVRWQLNRYYSSLFGRQRGRRGQTQRHHIPVWRDDNRASLDIHHGYQGQ